MMNKILLFGGTFNPIHNGHLKIAQEAVEELGFDEAIFIPSATPPHKKDVLCLAHRLKMIELAIEDVDYFKISDLAAFEEGPSYTIYTVRYFQRVLRGNAEIYWLIGADTIKELKTWYKISELLKECKFVVANRDPHKSYNEEKLYESSLVYLSNSILDISSTRIRERIHNEDKYAAKFLIPEKVERYIYDNELYRHKS